MLNAIFRRIFPDRDRSAPASPASAVYGSIVAQARQPVFYADLGVPDTPTGRFEMIVLHAIPVFRRLKGTQELDDAGQAVFDLFISDMDRSLRELGVGDLSVPKQMKHIGQAFYGHASVYGGALDQRDPEKVAEAVQQNVFATNENRAELAVESRAIGDYLIACDGAVAQQDPEPILGGEIAWPPLPGATAQEESAR
ncbi:ubiquinol-cytochrome C chaperone family protein [Tepidamorphus sp. 3E244]|uniref:ubiquinol-cytochrome C chaperone family protein n=1 Tax=Tepidamorphus sp. 3E244 TaxID=3385498 RepID=UPI0038FCBD62